MLAWAFSTWFGASHSSCPCHIHQWRQNSPLIIDCSFSIRSSLVHLNSPFPICGGICIPLFDCVLSAWVHSFSRTCAWAMNSTPEAWDKAVILSWASENESVTFKTMCSPWFGNCLSWLADLPSLTCLCGMPPLFIQWTLSQCCWIEQMISCSTVFGFQNLSVKVQLGGTWVCGNKTILYQEMINQERIL